MKKFFISILLFLSFFNGVASNDYKDKNLRDNHEATIEIESESIAKMASISLSLWASI